MIFRRRPSDPGAQATGAERRAYRRAETSLIARFTTDGQSIDSGTVQSLSASGAFVACNPKAAIGAAIRLEVGLGGELGLLRTDGIVIRHNRRSGTNLVTGLAIQFEELDVHVVLELDRFVTTYPGPFTVSAQGEIHWPLGEARAGLAGPHSCLLSELVPGASAVLEEMLRAAPPASDAPVTMQAHGWPLVPQLAVPGSLLNHGLECVTGGASTPGESFPEELPEVGAESEPAVSLSLGWIAQAWVAGVLERMEWRFVGATEEVLEEIGAAADYTRITLDRITQTRPLISARSASDRDALEEMQSALGILSRFLKRATANLEAALCLVTGSAVTPGLGTNWLQEGPAIEPPAREGIQKPDESPQVRVIQEFTVRRLTPRRTLGVLLTGLLLASATFSLTDYLRWKPPQAYVAYLPIAREGLAALDRGDGASLGARIIDARELLGAQRLDIHSYAALETAQAAIVFVHRVQNAMAGAPTLKGRAWGARTRYASLEDFLAAQQRDLIRGQRLLTDSTELLREKLDLPGPYREDLNRTRASGLRGHLRWLESRTLELEHYR